MSVLKYKNLVTGLYEPLSKGAKGDPGEPGEKGDKGDQGDPATNLVQSVNGEVGEVTLGKSDIGLSNVDNTSDASKPISSAAQTALNNKLDLSGGVVSGTLKVGLTATSAEAFAVTNSSGAVMFSVDSTTGNEVSTVHLAPKGNLVRNLGRLTAFWSNLYAQRLNLNATAYIDGATAGRANVVATSLAINGTNGATGTFTTVDGKTVTVTKGLITAIV